MTSLPHGYVATNQNAAGTDDGCQVTSHDASFALFDPMTSHQQQQALASYSYDPPPYYYDPQSYTDLMRPPPSPSQQPSNQQPSLATEHVLAEAMQAANVVDPNTLDDVTEAPDGSDVSTTQKDDSNATPMLSSDEVASNSIAFDPGALLAPIGNSSPPPILVAPPPTAPCESTPRTENQNGDEGEVEDVCQPETASTS